MAGKFEQEFQEKTVSASEAVRLIKSGDGVWVGTSSSVAYALCRALGERENELEDVTIGCSVISRPLKIAESEHFKFNSYFMGETERKGLLRNATDYTSVHLSQVEIWCRNTMKMDVAFLEVSVPDENGYMSLGASGVGIGRYVKENAKKIIVQINKYAPYVYGEDNVIHISEVDRVVREDEPLVESQSLPFDDDIQKISDYILDQIPDGACLQLGIGGVANAVGFGLKKKNDLGAHTELMTDSLMELMKEGVLNNSQKKYMRGKTVACFSLGSEELYRFIDHNPDMHYMPFGVVNNPVNIAKNDNMISINTALSIDIFGQVSADNIAGQQYSGTGGQVDFVRGAQMSKGGKSFIAVSSTVNSKRKGRFSRIVSGFPVGTAVTTPRSDVQYVVTEFGCVNLKPLSMKDRVRAMISLAHPDFRPQLMDDAKAAGLYQ